MLFSDSEAPKHENVFKEGWGLWLMQIATYYHNTTHCSGIYANVAHVDLFLYDISNFKFSFICKSKTCIFREINI